MKALRVVIADPSPLIRSWLRQALSRDDGFEEVGEASNGAACVQLVCRLAPNIVLLNVSISDHDAPSVTREIMEKFPTPILIFASRDGCARTAKGHAAVPPRNAMNSRRLIIAPEAQTTYRYSAAPPCAAWGWSPPSARCLPSMSSPVA